VYSVGEFFFKAFFQGVQPPDFWVASDELVVFWEDYCSFFLASFLFETVVSDILVYSLELSFFYEFLYSFWLEACDLAYFFFHGAPSFIVGPFLHCVHNPVVWS